MNKSILLFDKHIRATRVCNNICAARVYINIWATDVYNNNIRTADVYKNIRVVEIYNNIRAAGVYKNIRAYFVQKQAGLVPISQHKVIITNKSLLCEVLPSSLIDNKDSIKSSENIAIIANNKIVKDLNLLKKRSSILSEVLKQLQQLSNNNKLISNIESQRLLENIIFDEY